MDQTLMSDGTTNWTVKEYLELMRGPQQISYEIVIPITVVYIIIFVTGVIGNVIVCLVIARNASFQTPTNYYLFSLAISDLLILLFGLPNDLKVYWQQYPWIFGETVCKLRAFVAEMTSYASVLTIVAFSTERYLAICHPLVIQTVSSLSRTIKILTGVWVASCLCAIPFAIFTRVNYLLYPNGTGSYLQESAFCALPMDNNDISLPLVQFSSFIFFCLPMTLIVIIYVKIGLQVRESRFSRLNSQNRSSSGNSRVTSGASHSPVDGGGAGGSSERSRTSFRESKQPPARRSINKMLIAVVIAFFVCWAPFHTQRLFACFFDPSEWTRTLRQLNEILYYTGGCLYYFSATINPILYSLMSVRYREAFRDALCAFGTPNHADRHVSNILRYSHRPSDTCVIQDKASPRDETVERASVNGTLSKNKFKNVESNKDSRTSLIVTFRKVLCRICTSKTNRETKPVHVLNKSVPKIKITVSSPDSSVSMPRNSCLVPNQVESRFEAVGDDCGTNVDTGCPDVYDNETKDKIKLFRETTV